MRKEIEFYPVQSRHNSGYAATLEEENRNLKEELHDLKSGSLLFYFVFLIMEISFLYAAQYIP